MRHTQSLPAQPAPRAPAARLLYAWAMQLHVLRHAPSTFPARPNAWSERPILPVEGRHRERAIIGFGGFNPLAGAVPALPAREVAPVVACWSGWYPVDALPEHGVYPRDFRTWQPKAWDELSAVLDWLAPELAKQGHRLALRPHARHVLSDAQACMNFLQRFDSDSLGVLLDPAATLTADMLELAEDHLVRAWEALAAHPRVPAIVLTNVEMVELADRVELRSAPIHKGILDEGMLIDLARTHGAGKPIVLLEEQLAGQLAVIHARLRR